ncbi:MAG: DNA-processing protein DprA [Burkholderiales bacterium]|nr:DNA-processing protein DprA [Burkholderiales bacterium]
MERLPSHHMGPSSAPDAATSTAALALMIAGTHDAAAVCRLLRGLPSTATPEGVLDMAGVVRAAVNGSFAQAHALVYRGLDAGIEAIPLCSSRYPAWLRLLPDAPPVLYLRGNVAAIAPRPTVAIVGTRRATPTGQAIAQRLAAYLSSHGWCVVSGLAAGVNAAALAGALECGQPTVAVLAHGLEGAPPRSNSVFAEQILAQGGAWVSEHPHGARVRDEHDVLSKRIQVGLAAGSVVVEGAAKSAALSHAEFCLRERRALFAVVPQGIPTQSQLPRSLVERGAQVIRSRDDYSTLLAALAKASDALAASSHGSAR